MRPMVMPYGAYHNRMQTMTSTTTMTRSSGPSSSHITSPNAGKSSPTAVNRSVRSPSNSQKSFGARDQNRSVGRGGFGKNSGNATHTNPGRSRGFGGSSRGFGGGGHSFGGRRR
jgi:hypothetical protein